MRTKKYHATLIARRCAGRRPHLRGDGRSGAAAVELAIVLPVVVVLFLGVCEMGQSINATSNMVAGVREAGRLACMDFSDLLPPGVTANQKIEQDLRGFLLATGLPGNDVTITITHAEGSQLGQVFDLSDPDNYLKLFRLEVSVPYNLVSSYPLRFMLDRDLRASIVFRRGRVNMSN